MKPEIVIALYRPHKGKEDELRKLINQHVPVLRKLELITDRTPVLARCNDGTFMEIFEWRTAESADLAHHLPEVAEIWESMGRVADFVKLADLEEIHEQFPHFQSVS